MIKAEQLSGCHGKTPYENSHTAKQIANKAVRRPRGVSLTVYKCPHCSHFHIGSKLK